MDEDKLKWLSKLEQTYPYVQDVPSQADVLHLYYLHEKNLVKLRWKKGIKTSKKIEDLPILKDPNIAPALQASITAHGLDAISLLLKELRELKDFIPNEKSKGQLESIFKSPIYLELKDIALTFLAKFGSEISKN